MRSDRDRPHRISKFLFYNNNANDSHSAYKARAEFSLVKKGATRYAARGLISSTLMNSDFLMKSPLYQGYRLKIHIVDFYDY